MEQRPAAPTREIEHYGIHAKHAAALRLLAVVAQHRMLQAMRDLELPRGEAIPKRFLRARFVRAGGPGGQNVNKVATKVDLRLDLEGALEILGQSRVDRIRAKLDGRLDADGSLHVTSSEHRSQLQNLEAAITRMETLIRGALVRPKKRRPTKPTRASKKRRVEGKRQRGDLKKGRAGKDWS